MFRLGNREHGLDWSAAWLKLGTVSGCVAVGGKSQNYKLQDKVSEFQFVQCPD